MKAFDGILSDIIKVPLHHQREIGGDERKADFGFRIDGIENSHEVFVRR